jgi:hypothetical protein
LLNSSTPKSLLENSAVTIGRLGLIYPEVVASHLDKFGKTWCTVLWDIKDNDEKGSAFLGFCQLVMLNPNGMIQVRLSSSGPFLLLLLSPDDLLTLAFLASSLGPRLLL